MGLTTVRFSFATAHHIIFGTGTLSDIAPVAKGMGRRVFVVTGSTPSRATLLLNALSMEGLACFSFSTHAEPALDDIRQGVDHAHQEKCDLIIGFGGGSAIDTAKAIAAILSNGGDPLDYLEIIGRGLPLSRPSTPWIAIPTTAGSGAEVTSNAVISSPDHRVKVSLRSPLMHAKVVLVDPALTFTLPPSLTASTGLDALTQLIEPYVSIRANPLTDALCREGIPRAARSVKRAYEHGNDAQAREDMSLAALLGGLALSNAKLGAVHGIAGPLGGMVPSSHGSICARLLAPVMEANIAALNERLPESTALTRYEEIARIFTGNVKASAMEGVAWAQDLCETFRVPSLSSFGLKRDDFTLLIEKAQQSSSMQGNPVTLTAREIENILRKAF
ncbi:MAG: iron-containing alcohol dehydrogenase [bacterium]